MHPNVPGLLRLPVLGALLIFSLIVLGLDAHFVSEWQGSHTYSEFGFTYTVKTNAPDFTKLGVATSVITLATVLPMIIIDFLRKGAPTSWVAVELGWFGFLWILWLATAADTANAVDCSGVSGNNICSQAQAAEAFSFLAWLMLMAYWILLLVFAIIAHNNGDSGIWQTGVRDADFTNGGNKAPGAGGYGAPAGAGAPVQQRQGVAPATYPPQSAV